MVDVSYIIEDSFCYKGIFDICIESLSNSTQREVERDTVQKKGEYADAGVREYYILDPENQHMAFYQLNRQGAYVLLPVSNEGIIRSTVLTGFQFCLSDLHTMPSLVQMSEDPIYGDFVLPDYRQKLEDERARAEQERQRAEQARQRAEQERLRAVAAEAQLSSQAQEIARLKALLEGKAES